MAKWESAIYGLLHPVQVGIIEAHVWIDEPLSATILVGVFDRRFELSKVSYHVRNLARIAVLQEVATRQRRGALEHFYRLSP